MTRKTNYRYTVFETKYGHAAVVYKEAPFFLVKIILPRKDRDDVILEIDKEATHGKNEKTDIVIRAIIDYFEGKPTPSFWDIFDFGALTSLEIEVLNALSQIPFGELTTYKSLAENIGRPKAARFVGNVMAKNPFPILIPCHRVIKSDKSYGKFGGGVELKKAMIRLEQQTLKI